MNWARASLARLSERLADENKCFCTITASCWKCYHFYCFDQRRVPLTAPPWPSGPCADNSVLSLCHVSAWRGGLSAWLLIVCILSQSISINMKNHFCQGFFICFGVRLVVKFFLSPACLPLCASGGALCTLLCNIIVNRKVYDKTFTWIELRSHTTKLTLFCKGLLSCCRLVVNLTRSLWCSSLFFCFEIEIAIKCNKPYYHFQLHIVYLI